MLFVFVLGADAHGDLRVHVCEAARLWQLECLCCVFV